MIDHDQRFKHLLQTFFPEFVQLFFARFADRFDFDNLTWLDKELFRDAPEGERFALDLVARVPVREATAEPWLALIHIEVESADSVATFHQRMYEYYTLLRGRHGHKVLPIAVYLSVGFDGLGKQVHTEEIFAEEVLTFRYNYVGLPGLDAHAYLAGDNALGLALTALMRNVPAERARLKVEAVRRIVEIEPNAEKRFLLAECVDAYLPLESPQRAEFEHLLLSEKYHMARPVFETTYERGIKHGIERGREEGIEQGIEQGIERGRMELLAKQIGKRFGVAAGTLLERLRRLSGEQLETIALRLLDAESLADLGLAE